MTGQVFFKDVVPYEIVSSLTELRGPADGVLELPIWVFWGPEPRFDMSVPGETVYAYQALIRDGREADQRQFLNEQVLTSIWPALRLPDRCRSLWEGQFPTLVAAP